jgi:hypothetical protein
MNRFYLIVPLVMVCLFGGVYWQHHNTSTAEAARLAAAAELARAAEAAQKDEAARLAREDSARRAAERVAEEQKKEDEKRAKWTADGLRIEEETARFTARVAELTREIAQAEVELAALRTAEEKLDRENFELAREVELARIAKRNAELEIQRAVDVVAQRAAVSMVTQN